MRGYAVSLAGVMLAATNVLAADGALHVASPDWRDQIVYFVMLDRFDDGDPTNNDQGAGEYDPASGAHYSGGDLVGLARRLDYVQGLGATALWITPPVRHQWWDGSIGYGGYHGYWGEHFAQVDPHFGTLRDYQALARALHGRGMYLMQDVVVNHTGNYFSYPRGHDLRAPRRDYARNPDPRPNAAPTQWPFTLNDARDPAQRAADIYHWTPDIGDFTDVREEREFQLSALDDLNTENPQVRRALRASYGHWIRNVGVDALRIDTAFYVPPDYFADFLRADDAAAPGVLRVAAATGRENFHVFGEGFGVDPPYVETQARKIDGYMRDPDGRERLPAMLNFPLYGSLLDVFARGRESAVLGHRIRSLMRLHARPHTMPSFVDNHDVDRFLAGGSDAGLRQALLAIHTLPGIPVIYYGTEQGYREPRAAMFARGYGAGGRDHFDADAPLYRYLQRLAALRRAHPVLSRGTPSVLDENAAAAGALVYAMRHEAQTALIAFNSAEHAVLLAGVDTGLPSGTRLDPRFAIDGETVALAIDARGRLTGVLPPRGGYVWLARDGEAAPSAVAAPPDLDPLPAASVSASLSVSGRARPEETLHLVVDGDLSRTHSVRAGNEGHWHTTLDTQRFIDAAIEHRLVAWSPDRGTVSAPQRFLVAPVWQALAEVADAAGDDRGPQGRYEYPTDPLWRSHRPGDLRSLRVATAGGALRLELDLNEVIAGWNPPNGFDHVALTVFVELPERAGGARVMPGQNAELPDGMRWHYRLRVGGWSNALYSSDGADAKREGTPVVPAASLTVDAVHDRVTLILSAAALGAPRDLHGARLYVTTWDYDGGFRALAPEPAPFVFGGGAAADPKVLDAIGPLQLQRARH